MTSQTLNLAAAWIGALAEFILVRHLPNQAVPVAACAAILILWLSQGKHRSPMTLTLCAILGLACTRFTVSLVS